MKISFVAFVLVFSFTVLGCKKHKNDIPVVGISFNISNSGHWIAITYTAQIDTYIDPRSGDTTLSLDIFGYYTKPTASLYESFSLIAPNKIGAYNVTNGPGVAAIYYHYPLQPDNEGISGTVTVTQITANNVQGYFNCVLSPSGWAITNGEFNLSLQ
jgi:hypothetical protein